MKQRRDRNERHTESIVPSLLSAYLYGQGRPISYPLHRLLPSSHETDEKVARCIREQFSFEPTMEFIPAQIGEDQLISWPALLDRIPELIFCQLEKLGC